MQKGEEGSQREASSSACGIRVSEVVIQGNVVQLVAYGVGDVKGSVIRRQEEM